MQTLRTERNSGNHWMIRQHVERVPSHVRDLQIGVGRRYAVDLARYPTETRRDPIFASALGHQLHAYADAEERLALLAHSLFKRIDHSGNFIEPPAAICECTDARQHDAIGPRDGVGIAGDDNRPAVTPFAARWVESR